MGTPSTTSKSFITILLAEDNDVSREMMGSILKTQGYDVVHARDGGEAIRLIGTKDVDLALVDVNMSPTGGFEFVRHLLVQNIDVPVVIVTADGSSDMLVEAGNLSVQRVLQKPIQPQTLLDTVSKILKRRGINPSPMGVQSYGTVHSPEALMRRAIELAERNARTRRGGPFGAVVATAEGKILGEGTNGITSRSDPTAHAEVMAIRQAAERLGRSDLSDCALYVSSEPTMMGKALIASVGIPKVYFGLTHDEVREIRKREDKAPDTAYEQLCHAEAEAMLRTWQEMGRDKVAD